MHVAPWVDLKPSPNHLVMVHTYITLIGHHGAYWCPGTLWWYVVSMRQICIYNNLSSFRLTHRTKWAVKLHHVYKKEVIIQ